MADVLAAPDPYDGAAPADVYGVGFPADNTPKTTDLRETAAKFGLSLAALWLFDHGHKDAAICLMAHAESIVGTKTGAAG